MTQAHKVDSRAAPAPLAAPGAPASVVTVADPRRLEEVKQRILAAGDLPTLPMIALEVSRLAANPLSGMSEIVRIIRNDPPLTAKILRVANSAFYGMPRRIESLNMALVVLGMRELVNLVTCISVLRVFPPVPGANFSLESFWEHSAGTGEIARVIAARLRLRLHGVEFTAGLLHDIGKIVLDQHLHSEFTEAVKLAAKEGLSSAEAEQRVFGTDHAEIGAWLAETWLLPPSIVETIRCHHRLSQATEHAVLTAAVRLADILTRVLSSGGTQSALNNELMHDAAWEILAQRGPEIMSLDVPRFVEELEENMERAREFIRLARA